MKKRFNDRDFWCKEWVIDLTWKQINNWHLKYPFQVKIIGDLK